MNKVLLFYVSIKNHSSKKLEFHHTPIYMSANQGWNMILKKNNVVKVEWDDSRYMGDIYRRLKTFIIEGNKEFNVEFPIQISSMVVSGSNDNLSGNDTCQLILSTAESRENNTCSVSSNVIGFEIK